MKNFFILYYNLTSLILNYRGVIAVSKDLGQEFYEYFPEFLSTFIDLLQTKDAEQLEYTFTALAYLFKSLWRCMIKNIDQVFKLLVPLLADTKPKYINNFAAESFAFVVRKVKDKEKFFKQIVVVLEKRQNGIVGCGKLLFYVLAGVPGQFNLCAEDILSVYLSALEDTSLDQNLLYELLSTIFSCITNEIHPQKCDILWTVIYKKIKSASENCLLSLMKLVQLLINHRGGIFVKDSSIWSRELVELIDKHERNDLLLEEISNAVVASLLASNIKFLQETLSFLIIKLLSTDNEILLLKITEKLIPCSYFENMILPKIMEKKIISVLSEKSLQLFSKIIELKSPPILSGIKFDKWKKFSLKISGPHNSMILSQHLDSLKEGEVKENALHALIILPHLTTLENYKEHLIKSFNFLFERISKNNDHQQKLHFAFLLIMECLAHLSNTPDEFYSSIKECLISEFNLFSAAVLYKDDILILNALDLCLNIIKYSSSAEKCISLTNFDKLHESLAAKLGKKKSKKK